MKKKLLTMVTLCMLGCASVVLCMKNEVEKNNGYDSDPDTEYSVKEEKFKVFTSKVRRGASFKRGNLKNLIQTDARGLSVPSSKTKKVGCRCSSDCYIL